MPRRALSCCVSVFVLLFTASAWAQNLVGIYVQAGDGTFAGNGAGDSAADVRKALLGKTRNLRLVDDSSQADIILRIDSRDQRKETESISTYSDKSDDGKSKTTTTRPNVTTIDQLHATILIGTTEVPMNAESSLSWRLAAGNLASSVDHWAQENYGKLMDRRKQSGHAAPAAAQPAAAATPVQPAGDANIAPGMTESQVQDAMGTPDKKISFGKRSMWNYRGMQVVFEDGKVTDVKF